LFLGVTLRACSEFMTGALTHIRENLILSIVSQEFVTLPTPFEDKI